VARALIVGCGCRGRALGKALLDAGWQVRGTTRSQDRLEEIRAAGVEAAIADPDRAASILDQVADVALIFWLLGSALGETDAVAALHGPRLERVLAEIVDTPVRGFVYEHAGGVAAHDRQVGAAIVGEAAERWRIPVEVVDADPSDQMAWREAMLDAADRIVAGATEPRLTRS
jgi:NADP-dependent 3-hydroxy acid dehydrogenase YdfG